MRYRVFQPPYGMRLARDLAAAALLLWIADAVLRTVALDRPDPLIWAAVLWFTIVAVGLLPGLHRATPRARRELVWRLLVWGCFLQSLAFASAAVVVLVQTLRAHPFEPLSHRQIIPLEFWLFFLPGCMAAVPGALVLMIWALASSPYSRLLAVAQFLIVFPFLAYVGVALLSML